MRLVGGTDLLKAHLISFDKLHVLDEFGLEIRQFAPISDPTHHEAAADAAMEKIADAGEVGSRLATFARISRDLELVCWPGVPGEFLCPEEAAKVGRKLERPTIMWDPYVTFQYFATGQPRSKIGETVSALQAKGLKTSIAPKAGPPMFKGALMPAWVVLAHEIGHFYHYRHASSWFTSCLDNGDIAGIERQNLQDHENPVLKHIGLPTRTNYQDFRGGANDTADKHIVWGAQQHGDGNLCATVGPDLGTAKTTFDALLREAERKKAEKDRKAKTQAPPVSGKVNCPKCHKPFAPMILRGHEPTCKGV